MNNQLENSRGHHRNHQSKYPLQQYPYTQGNQQETGFLQDSKAGSSHLEFSSTILAFGQLKSMDVGCTSVGQFQPSLQLFRHWLQGSSWPRSIRESQRDYKWKGSGTPANWQVKAAVNNQFSYIDRQDNWATSQLLRTGLIELCLPSF